MRFLRNHYFWIFLCVALIVFARWRVEAKYEWRYPALDEMMMSEHYAGDLGFLMLGSRRLAADIAYIQYLQYYGVSEHHHDEDCENSTDTAHAQIHDFASGNYPLLKEKIQRVLRLDPFFNQAVLEGAGALAFNQKRSDEALDVLSEGIRRDPAFFRYRLYVGAIAYSDANDDRKLMALLDEAIQYNDCPRLLENILANLHKKFGEYTQAFRIYIHMLETAPGQADLESALIRAQRLAEDHPEALAGLTREEKQRLSRYL